MQRFALTHVFYIWLGIFFSGNACAGTFDLDALLRIIDEKKLSTMEEVIPELPAELRSSFTLQFSGRGLQEASPMHPRAILFGSDAKFVLTFNGHPDQRQYDKFEILQFNEAEGVHEMYALKFPIERDATGHAVRPMKNPRNCTACHGLPPHPIWDPYRTWTGIYGSNNDLLEGEELASFKAFMATRLESPRYSHLLPMAGSEVSPYRFLPTQKSVQFRPNTRLGALFYRWNSVALAKRVENSPYYPRFWKLWTLVAMCGRPEFPEVEARKLSAIVEPLLRAQFAGTIPYPTSPIFGARNLSALFGTTQQDWFLQLPNATIHEGDSLAYYDGSNFFRSNPIAAVASLRKLVRVHPELADYFSDASVMGEYGGSELLQTPFDIEWAENADRIAVDGSLKTDGCKKLKQIVVQDLLGSVEK